MPAQAMHMKMYVKDRATKVPRCENYGWFGMYSTRQLKHIGYILYSGKLLREKTFMKTFRGENFHRILSHAIVYWVWYTQNFHGGTFTGGSQNVEFVKVILPRKFPAIQHN